jgi:hypothetical protein
LLLTQHVQNKLFSLDFGGSNKIGYGNGGGACSIVDQMGVKGGVIKSKHQCFTLRGLSKSNIR